MKEVLITSTVLIAALLILRRIFRKTLSRRVQYALWGLVLVRLLVPVSLPAVDFSVLTAARPIQDTVAARVETQPFYIQPVTRTSISDLPQNYADHPGEQTQSASGPYAVPDQNSTAVRQKTEKLTPSQVLDMVWKAGMALMGIFFLLSNLRFWRRLRRCRRPYPVTGTSRRVYLVENGALSSPFLFGLFRPAVYLTPAALSSEQSLRHVLVHEETHARHLDPLWALLRCVCLAVYWFDPLVWIAAACSKADCELACDEGALARLGEEQRIPYGQTLLSLIPVRKGPGNPLIIATTMAAKKKQIRNRITRIAQRPRHFVAAAVAVVVLAGAVSACTFTGAKSSVTPADSESETLDGPVALTGEELRFFNEQWFNSGGADQSQGLAASLSTGEVCYYNIRNQFLSSTYEKPEDIDLYGLFYCEGSTPSDEEIRTILNSDPSDLPCPAYKLTTAEMDEVLTQYMGLTLDKTSQIGLEQFTYNAGNDAYYWLCGDTNYRSLVSFTAGTTDGRTVKLYYQDGFTGDGWKCLTLTSMPGNVYQFQSNVACGAPAIPAPLPDGEPAAIISLQDLEPYTAEAVTVEKHTGDYEDSHENRLENWLFDGHNVMIYRSTDGNIYAAEQREDGTMDVFLTVNDEASISFFHGLFGHDGFCIDFSGKYGEHTYGPVRDYYYFTGDGALALLARCETHAEGDPMIVDLDGDGTSELASSRQLFFQRDGLVYEARLPELLTAACPELSSWYESSWDPYAKCLTAQGGTDGSAAAGTRDWTRYFFFGGENLLIYQIEESYTDHMVDGADKDIPAEVISAARDYVRSLWEEQPDGTYLQADREEDSGLQETYDDWRVESFTGPYAYTVGDVSVEAWAFNYECHTTTPEEVVLAGGKYITEDGWVSPGSPGCAWLFFQIDNGKRALLWHEMINNMSPDSLLFRNRIEQRLQELGVDVGTTYAALQAQWTLDAIMDTGGYVLLSLSTESGGGSYIVSPDDGNGRFFQNWFTEPNSYRWTEIDPPTPPTGDTLIIADPDWYQMLQFWAGSDLVMTKKSNQEPVWYRAETLEEPTSVFYEYAPIYNYMRQWFDEAELRALQQDIVIPDRGQSREEIVRAWTEQHEGAHLKATRGSCGAWNYMKIEKIDQWDVPQGVLEEMAGKEAFVFSYQTVLVPENDLALMRAMAGNTGDYTGGDSDVPDGALEYDRIGYMYRTQEGWRCDEVGTG